MNVIKLIYYLASYKVVCILSKNLLITLWHRPQHRNNKKIFLEGLLDWLNKDINAYKNIVLMSNLISKYSAKVNQFI